MAKLPDHSEHVVRVRAIQLDLDLMSEAAHSMSECLTSMSAAISKLGFQLMDIHDREVARRNE